MTNPKVLLTRTLPPASQNIIENSPDIELIYWKDDTIIPRHELLRRVSVGYDHVDINELRKRNISLGYTPEVLTEATAVLASALENGEWSDWSPTGMLGTQLTNKTIGIVGFGRIGEATAFRLKPFLGTNGKIIYYSPTEKKRSLTLGVKRVEFDLLLEKSDVICICCSLNENTKEMFNYSVFKKMKKDVILVNTARGSIIKQDDLVQALSESLIGAVGLDVTTPEPLDGNHPLLKFPNVTIVPHIGSATLETRTLMGNLAVENVLCGVKGLSLPNAVKL
ncbi:973_t:CDS:2 [Diversispora eburnea]|uniref:973_t:CDS:1 n=1 Tax=Diversispora eburnea TaxID=1213867 RepID=A0A9N8W8I2_9GLOM|nr:973_t:CDS:2 [Diversispora eburnea]